MQVTLTLGDMIAAAAIVVPLGAGALYWAVRSAIRDAVKSLQIEVLNNFVTKDECRAFREECSRHRHDMERALRS